MVIQMSSSAWQSSQSSTTHKRSKVVLSSSYSRRELEVLASTWLQPTKSSSLIQTGTQWSTSKRLRELCESARQEMCLSIDSFRRRQLKRRSITGRSSRSSWLIASSLTQLDGSYLKRRTSTTSLRYRLIKTIRCFNCKSQSKAANRRAPQRLRNQIVETSYLIRDLWEGRYSLRKQLM